MNDIELNSPRSVIHNNRADLYILSLQLDRVNRIAPRNVGELQGIDGYASSESRLISNGQPIPVIAQFVFRCYVRFIPVVM